MHPLRHQSRDLVPTAGELLSAEERLRLATEAADIGWWDVEQGNGRLLWPPRVKAMFGISPDAPVSLEDFYNGLHPDDRERVATVFASAADPARRAIYDVEYRTIGKEDGVIRWVAAKGHGVFDESDGCIRVIGAAIDITERKLAQEERLARQMSEAERREQCIAVLGHDVKNRLALVSSATRLMLRYPEQAAELAEQIELSITRMSALIENILDFTPGRIGGRCINNIDESKPLEPVLLQIIEELIGVHPALDFKIDIDLRELVKCDRLRIGQLLSNFLGNACVYCAPNTPVHVYARAEEGQFELSVTNSGEVIQPSEFERLFQPFFRGEVGGSRKGLGLGLYICSEIAKAHEGVIEVKTREGKTCFTFRMPTGF
ncbi:MAG: PAS domain-containing protein [Pyrinomonadaceae bacterium]|nr:PAS domain-containing protein [Pyrinomonadaceae bacterium]